MDPIKKKFREALGRRMKEVRRHFATDKWPLSLGSIASDAVYETLGLDSWLEVMEAGKKQGLASVYEDGDFLLVRKKTMKKDLAARKKSHKAFRKRLERK